MSPRGEGHSARRSLRGYVSGLSARYLRAVSPRDSSTRRCHWSVAVAAQLSPPRQVRCSPRAAAPLSPRGRSVALSARPLHSIRAAAPRDGPGQVTEDLSALESQVAQPRPCFLSARCLCATSPLDGSTRRCHRWQSPRGSLNAASLLLSPRGRSTLSARKVCCSLCAAAPLYPRG